MSEKPAKPAGIWDDFLDVFIAPSKVFDRRSDAKFGVALLVLTVLFAVLFFATRSLLQPVWEAEITRQLAANPNMTPEQMEAARRIGGTFAAISAVVGMPISVLVLGLVIWIAGRPVGARISYAQGATIATFAYFPKLIGQVVAAILAALTDEAALTSIYKVTLGIGRFLDPQQAGPAVMGLLGRIEVFTLWVTILIGMGLKRMGKITTSQAALGAAIIWLVGALPSLLGGLMGGR
ncbi:MAG: YIP1 family protein [Gemmatimonadales bacterium]